MGFCLRGWKQGCIQKEEISKELIDLCMVVLTTGEEALEGKVQKGLEEQGCMLSDPNMSVLEVGGWTW